MMGKNSNFGENNITKTDNIVPSKLGTSMDEVYQDSVKTMM